MSFEPRGKVVVITGASSGIGAATATRLARLGMQVVAVARRRDRLDEVAATHPGITPYVADVTDADAVDALAAWVADQYGACHVLVNNAGIGGGSFSGREDVEDAIHTLEVNLVAPIRCMGAFADLLAASAPARVVNVDSVAGKLGVGPAGYAASKFGLVGFSESTGFAWASRDVTVCELNPGFIETEGFTQSQIKRTPMGRLVGKPEDVARAVHDVILSGASERTVPRWYRALVVTRHVATPLYRQVASRMERATGSRE